MGYFRENIERMAGYTPGFQPKAADVVKLNTNENPYPPSPKVMEVIGRLHPERLRRYPEPLGDTFRAAAAKILGVRPENLICANGGDDLLAMCVRAFCDRQRPLAYAQPTYSLYPVLARIQDCQVIEISRATDWPAELAKVNAPLTIVCNPNAPTADFTPIEQLQKLAEALDGVLLIDEAYADFASDNAMRLVSQYDNVIVLRSLSKGYSLAGLRFGFGAADPALIEGLVKVKDSYNVDAAAIAAATAAILDQSYFYANVERIKTERQRLTESLRLLGLEVGDSQANFVLARYSKGSARPLFESLVSRNIFVRYFDLPSLEDKLRITVGTAEQNKILVAALRDILSEKGNKP
ncbi:MAG TPA: histidinol-phosphate transaminase [Anaerohalosphaeraceae bacterium]|jgi:histidinol-phosphate aminotransferase|nr:histidinol-phosphate transaminase [Anaerohalosphaeraceae bacterium]